MLPVASARLISATQFSTPFDWCSMPRACRSMARPRFADPVRGLLDGLRRHAGHLGGRAGDPTAPPIPRPLRSRWCGRAMKSRSARSVADDHVQHAHAAARGRCPDAPAGYRSALRAIGVMRGSATISFAAVVARPPDVVGGDRRALADVGADRPAATSAFGMSLHGIGRAVDAEARLCRRCRPRPCRGGRCSRCAGCRARRARTCPSGRPSRWSATRRRRPRRRPCRTSPGSRAGAAR